ncbi:BA75_02623T0 [Komagataella pastoris]|uniref:Derlin n=1 Tax=Komagataella pastoris TaxID=4922 RepID=A0A1B2JBJ7_PICPA|nr:BA75_02623T0 [Komagataella pastoris]
MEAVNLQIEWIRQVPPVTMALVASMSMTYFLQRIDVLSSNMFVFERHRVFNEVAYSRLILSFFFSAHSFVGFIWTLCTLFQNSQALELTYENSIDYLYSLVIIGGLIVAWASYLGGPFILGWVLADVLRTIWCKQNPNERMSILGLVSFKAGYFPFVVIAISWLEGSSRNLLLMLISQTVSQAYIFGHHMMPELHGIDLFQPIWKFQFFRRQRQPPIHHHQD